MAITKYRLLVGTHIEPDPRERRRVEEGIAAWRAWKADPSVPVGAKPPPGAIDPARRGELIDAANRFHCTPNHPSYKQGMEIIESDRDLCAMLDPVTDPNALRKFERLTGSGAVNDGLFHQLPGESTDDFIRRVQAGQAGEVPSAAGAPPVAGQVPGALPPDHPVQLAAASGFRPTDTLDAMTLDELKKHAQDEEIDVRGCKNREDYLKRLKAALVTQAAHVG